MIFYYPIYQTYMAANNFIYPMKDYIGISGCYAIDLIETASIMFFQMNSLYISIFRYVCLAHEATLIKRGITPRVYPNLGMCIALLP